MWFLRRKPWPFAERNWKSVSPTFGQNFSSSITRLASPWRAARNFKLPPQPEEHPRCHSARPSSNVRQVESLRRRPVRVERGSSAIKRNQVPPGGLVAIFSRPKKKTKEGRAGTRRCADKEVTALWWFFFFFEKRIRVGGCHLADASGEKTKEKRKEGRSGTWWWRALLVTNKLMDHLPLKQQKTWPWNAVRWGKQNGGRYPPPPGGASTAPHESRDFEANDDTSHPGGTFATFTTISTFATFALFTTFATFAIFTTISTFATFTTFVTFP